MKRFLPSILINHAVTVAIALVLAIIVGIGAKFSMVPTVIASTWMVFNAAPISADGAVLEFVPLLPALVLIVMHAKRTTKILGNRISVRGLRVYSVMALAIPLLLTIIAWLMLWDAGRVFNMPTPNLGRALLATLVVNGTALALGMRGRIWRALLLRRRLPTWPVESIKLAGTFLGWMTIAGLLATVISLIGNWSAVSETYDIARGFGAALGLTLMAVFYLPNVMISAAAILLGGEFNIGEGVSSLFSVTNVELPPVPVLAAVPNEPIPGGAFLLAVPAIVAIGAVFRFVRGRSFIESPVPLSLGAALAAAIIALLGAWIGRGDMGIFGTAGPVAWLGALEAAAWLGIPSLILMWYFNRAGQNVVEDVPTEQQVESEPATENEESEADDEDTEETESQESELQESDSNEAESQDRDKETQEPEEEELEQEESGQEDTEVAETEVAEDDATNAQAEDAEETPDEEE